MDIEKQAADLRCCGNCKHSGTKWDEDTEESYFGCSLLADTVLNPLAGEPCAADMVCASWTSDGKDEAWRKENHKEWCTTEGNFGLKLENPVDTLPEV